MVKFKKYIEEMATNMGTSPKGVFSKEEDFTDIKNNLSIIRDRLPGGYSALKNETDYFLVKNNNYKGHIEYSRQGDIVTINHSHSEITKGFYELMFSAILSDSKEILSDISLSSQAIKAYSNLNRRVSIFELAIKIGPKYSKYSEELLLSSRRAKVSIKAKHNIREVFEEYYGKLEIPLYNKDKTNKLLGYILFHEGWDNT